MSGNVKTRYPTPNRKWSVQWAAELIRVLTIRDMQTPNAPFRDDYTVTNYSESRTLNAGTATTAEVADFLCTLIQDLKSAGHME